MDKKYFTPKILAIIPLGIAVNMALGTIAHTLKVPFYLDAIGTIAITLLVGLPAGIIVGVGSFLIGGLLFNPVLPWFSCTQAIIAIYTFYMAKMSMYGSYPKTILSGVLLGVIAGVVSAPVIVYLFGGITGSGTSLITAYLIASGKSVFNSVIYSGLASEPLDKTIQSLIAVWLIRGLPKKLLSNYSNPSLKKNGML